MSAEKVKENDINVCDQPGCLFMMMRMEDGQVLAIHVHGDEPTMTSKFHEMKALL